MNKKLISGFFFAIVFCFSLNCCELKVKKQRSFWLSQDQFYSQNMEQIKNLQIIDSDLYMVLSPTSSFVRNKRVYYKVSNLFNIKKNDGYIAYDSSQYFFISNYNNREYLLFDISKDIIIDIDSIISMKIIFLRTCKLAPSYGYIDSINTFDIEILAYTKPSGIRPRNTNKIYIKGDKLLYQSFCEYEFTLACTLLDFEHGTIEKTGIYGPCEIYPIN